MLEPDVKAKIMNTIKNYEKTCQKLQDDISVLKDALKEFTLLPKGVYADVDEYISRLGLDLNNAKKYDQIQKSVNLLKDALSAHILSRQNQQNVIESRINKSLGKLVGHIIVPKEFHTSVYELEKILENQLENESLARVIDEITLLITDSSHAEQEQFKNFFQLITAQLHDFDNYLSLVLHSQDLSACDSRLLELNIQTNIAQIKDYMQQTIVLEELTPKLTANLEGIGNRIREYRATEAKREQEHAKQVNVLKQQLVQSETLADSMKELMSAQRFKINHDSLTGLANRFSYDDRLIDAINRFKRGNGELCLAMMDIDRFKTINDTYGHLAGDKVLKNLAGIFRNSTRAVDFLARYGGEEFVIILENTSRENAVLVMEKLRKLVQDSRFYYGNSRVEVTVSIGISSFMSTDDAESIFKRADMALYEAKNNGRNKVVLI